MKLKVIKQKIVAIRSLSSSLSSKQLSSQLINRNEYNTPDKKNSEQQFSQYSAISDLNNYKLKNNYDRESFDKRHLPKIYIEEKVINRIQDECYQNQQIYKQIYQKLITELSYIQKDGIISEYKQTIDKKQRQITDQNTTIDLYEKELLSQKDKINNHSILQVKQGKLKSTFYTIQEKQIHEMKNNNDLLQEKFNNLKEQQYQEFKERFALMSTEIEKLRTQNKIWKQKYQDLENEELQIIQKLNIEIENLTQILDKKQSEFDQIIQNLDDNREEIKRHAKNHMENKQKILQHQIEINDITEKLNQSGQINELQCQQLNEKEKILSKLNLKIEQQKLIISVKIIRISGQESKLQIELNKDYVNDEQSKQLEIQVEQCQNQIQDLKQYQNEVDEKTINLNIELRDKLKIIQNLEKRYEQLECSYNKIKPLEIQVTDQQDNIISLTKQIIRKNDQSIQKSKQIDEWKGLYQKEEQRVNNLKYLIEQYEQDLLNQSSKEKNNTSIQNIINEEIDRLNQEMKSIKLENEQLKSQLVDKNNNKNSNKDLLYKIVDLSSESMGLRLLTKQNLVNDIELSFLAPIRKNKNQF